MEKGEKIKTVSDNVFEDVEFTQEEPRVKRQKNLCQRILSNITIEPAFFVITFASGLDNIASEQMVIWKSCINDFNFTENICENLNNDTLYETEKGLVTDELTHFNFIKTLVTSIVPFFMAFYLGAWADIFGRKPIFYLFLTTYALEQAVVMVCAYYFDSPKEWLLLSYIPRNLAGGMAAWSLSVNAFLSDISAPEDRAFRFGMLSLVTILATPLSAQAGKYILQYFGYVSVFATTLGGICFGALLLIWRINRFKWNPPRKERNQRQSFSPMVIVDTFKTVFKWRPGNARKYILLLMVIVIFSYMPFFGEFTVSYSYTYLRYDWEVNENSDYSTITSIVHILAQAIFLPIMACLKLNETYVMPVLFCGFVIRHTVKAFAYEPWMYYLGSFIDALGFYAFNIRQSMVSCLVEPDELGKILAFTSAIDSVLPIGVTFAYSEIFKVSFLFASMIIIHFLIFFTTQATRDNLNTIGTVFLVSTGFSLVALVCSIYITISLKGKRMQDIAKIVKAQEEEKDREDRFKGLFLYDKGGQFSSI